MSRSGRKAVDVGPGADMAVFAVDLDVGLRVLPENIEFDFSPPIHFIDILRQPLIVLETEKQCPIYVLSEGQCDSMISRSSGVTPYIS
jgi:hypothetical protein